MIVNRRTLRESTSASEQQINSLMNMASKYQMICDHHTMMGLDSRGYLSPMACFNLAKLAKHLEERKVSLHSEKAQNSTKTLVLKVFREMQNARDNADGK